MVSRLTLTLTLSLALALTLSLTLTLGRAMCGEQVAQLVRLDVPLVSVRVGVRVS